jgi:hypothetical protein
MIPTKEATFSSKCDKKNLITTFYERIEISDKEYFVLECRLKIAHSRQPKISFKIFVSVL